MWGRFMERGSILFLKAVLLLVGIGALALMLWEPHIEGRNTHATLFEVYFKDPFLAYAYATRMTGQPASSCASSSPFPRL
jgi:hypothetical protein